MIHHHLLNLLFPPKCILCQRILQDTETDLCVSCRTNTQEHPTPKQKISFVAAWTAMWYYKDDVRYSILRYKFSGRRSYGAVYGKLLALHLLSKSDWNYDVITWVPVSRQRRWRRGYDQVELITLAMGEALGTQAVRLLTKQRHNQAQSGISGYAHRKANVLGAYRVNNPGMIAGKRILLLDDIITSGATVSECAKTLTIAGAGEVCCAAVAAANDQKSNKTM